MRLDETAISTLGGLREDDDFHVIHTEAGPVLSVGNDQYLASEEPDASPPLPRRVRRTRRAQPVRIMDDPDVLLWLRDGLLELDT